MNTLEPSSSNKLNRNLFDVKSSKNVPKLELESIRGAHRFLCSMLSALHLCKVEAFTVFLARMLRSGYISYIPELTACPAILLERMWPTRP